MSSPIQADDFEQLKQSLPAAFLPSFCNDERIIKQAFPLLNILCTDRTLINKLKSTLDILEQPSGSELAQKLSEICEALGSQLLDEPQFIYRLPIVLSEFPVHSRPINRAIQSFNAHVEAYHQGDVTNLASETDNEDCFQNIIKAVMEHGGQCDGESLWQLLEMMSGWSNVILNDFFPANEMPDEPTDMSSEVEQQIKVKAPTKITDIKQPDLNTSRNPFILDYSYNFNDAGRLDSETDYLLLNAFGMKIGGHFDAQVKYPPRYVPLDELHAIIRRQLSHRMEVSENEDFQLWIESTLYRLGVRFIQKNEGYLSKDVLVNPFLAEPISFLSPEKIQTILNDTLTDLDSPELEPQQSDIDIIGQYLFELLQGFQLNPGQALGIGANWDGTVNMSNESGTYAFKFIEPEAGWGRRFKQLSLHRQGPSEAKMNAAIGIKFEVQSLLSSFQYMSQLQPSEYGEVVYNALIDNLVTDLFPEPAYFENESYQKYRRQFLVTHTDDQLVKIDSYFVPSSQGTYFKHGQGAPKQTPMYRRAGTLDVMPFPRDSTCSEQSKAWYEGNPLGPLQLQHAQAMHKSARGHVVYNPIAPDQFLEDAYYGQVMRAENGDYLPFIGVVPKNFDKHFNQKNELCASFVLRMVQSSRIMEHCPTFVSAYQQIKTRFLPSQDSRLPELPTFCHPYLVDKRQDLISSLSLEDRAFSDCEHHFYALFKNLVYSLYEFGQEDKHFKHIFLSYVNAHGTFYPISRAKCDKIIRDLSVNKPINVSPDATEHYDKVLNYLSQLTTYFYPEPTERLAQAIAQEATLHVTPLLRSQGIKDYFKQQRNNKLNNLSRRQSPGMIFSTLKDGGPLKKVHQVYSRMHGDNFDSFYRDPDGTPSGDPQKQDRLLDFGAKKLGAGLQIMNKYHPFAALHYPISEPILHAKQRYAEHEDEKLKALWAVEGGIEGFFWHGLCKGLWHTATSPFKMLKDLIQWGCHAIISKTKLPLVNPLALPAAPANEPGVKTLAAAGSRDFLLKLLRETHDSKVKKEAVIEFSMKLLSEIYPHLSEEDKRIYQHNLETTFPLDTEQWQRLFKPLLSEDKHKTLSSILHGDNPFVNKSLLQAVFRCITNPLFARQPKDIIKETQSFFSLNAKQIALLKKLLVLYNQLPKTDQKSFLTYFKYGGELHHALLVRDQYVQRLQSFILKAFDEQALLELLLDKQIETLAEKLTEINVEQTIDRLPQSIKWPLGELIFSNDPTILKRYRLTKQESDFLLKIYTICQQSQEIHLDAILQRCQVNVDKDDRFLSVKDKAQQKWANFAERELRHQLLSRVDVHQILDYLSLKLRKLKKVDSLFDDIKEAYDSLDNTASLNKYYDSVQRVNLALSQFIGKQKKVDDNYTESQLLLNNLLNITMNSIVNSRLDGVDIFASGLPDNPLLEVDSIEQWLSGLTNNERGLRSFLDQQIQQSPSLDHAIWRCKSILQVLEQKKPEQKIAKTGMQSLLRFWIQHKANITTNGEQYIGQMGEMESSSIETLTEGSVTINHAMNRVRAKLSPFSMFRTIPNGESGQSEKQALSMLL